MSLSKIGTPTVLFTVLALAISSVPVSSSAAAQNLPTAPVQVAQTGGSIVGQCRAAKQSTAVYQQANTTSAVVRVLATNERVTLADNGAAGFIRISTPAGGYVQTANLKLCPDGGTPNPNLCRKSIQSQNLVVRSQPNKNSQSVGSIPPGGRVYLTTSPPNSRRDNEGRAWVEINRPVTGWVSNGFPGQGGNLVYCQ